MRYLAAEKLEIIRVVEQPHLSVRRTLAQVGVPMRVAFLAPDLKRAILDGIQPGGLSLQKLLTHDMPLAWQLQRELYRS
jgi:hypothetical protein